MSVCVCMVGRRRERGMVEGERAREIRTRGWVQSVTPKYRERSNIHFKRQLSRNMQRYCECSPCNHEPLNVKSQKKQIFSATD
jgi:hypothetical protein